MYTTLGQGQEKTIPSILNKCLFVSPVGRSFVRTDGQRENSIPSHKNSLRGYNYDGLESQMLHTKFRGNRPAGSGEEDF